MLSSKLTHKLDKPLAPFVRLLPFLGISPNMLTIAGAIISIASAFVIAYGNLMLGGILILVGGLFDLLDGALARVTAKETKFGNVLDSTLDRYSDMIPLLGLLLYYTNWYRPGELRLGDIALCGAVMLGSLMVPYVRAKAESVGLRCDVGIAERAERILIFSAGLIFGFEVVALWVLAVLTHLTVIQRMLHVRGQLRSSYERLAGARPEGEKLVAPDVKSDP